MKTNSVLLQINTRVWLEELKQKLGETDNQLYLDSIPIAVWKNFKDQGFDVIYLLGVWDVDELTDDMFQKKNLKLEFNQAYPEWKWTDTCGSPFSIKKYEINPHLGNNETLRNLKTTLNSLHLELILDFVPNHFGLQTDYVEHSNFFIEEINFSSSTREYDVIETATGKKAIYHGKDPYFPPWEDTFQLDYSSEITRKFMIDQLKNIAVVCDGIRCDMAMLLVNHIIQQNWGWKITGNLQSEFWYDAIKQIKEINPNFTFIAEVYWDMEEELLNLGFDYCYDKKLYDAIRDKNIGTLEYMFHRDFSFHEKTVRFLENHDEPRAVTVFKNQMNLISGVITFTLPGIKFFHQKQLNGFAIKESLFLLKRSQEPINTEIQTHYLLLLKILRKIIEEYSKWNFGTTILQENMEIGRNIYAWEWIHATKNTKIVCLVNFKEQTSLLKIRDNIPLKNITELSKENFGYKIFSRSESETIIEINPLGSIILEINS